MEYHEKLHRAAEDVQPPKNLSAEDNATPCTIPTAITSRVPVMLADTVNDYLDGKRGGLEAPLPRFNELAEYKSIVFASPYDETKLRVPLPPMHSFEYGKPFECPYCCTIKIVLNKIGWK